MHILEREDREFRQAMRGQVGTTLSSTKGLNKTGCIKMFTDTGIITQCPTIKESKFRLCLPPNILLFSLYLEAGSGPQHCGGSLKLVRKRGEALAQQGCTKKSY